MTGHYIRFASFTEDQLLHLTGDAFRDVAVERARRVLKRGDGVDSVRVEVSAELERLVYVLSQTGSDRSMRRMHDTVRALVQGLFLHVFSLPPSERNQSVDCASIVFDVDASSSKVQMKCSDGDGWPICRVVSLPLPVTVVDTSEAPPAAATATAIPASFMGQLFMPRPNETEKKLRPATKKNLTEFFEEYCKGKQHCKELIGKDNFYLAELAGVKYERSAFSTFHDSFRARRAQVNLSPVRPSNKTVMLEI
jgi:hypothetical protein